jgi:hypothetical protein
MPIIPLKNQFFELLYREGSPGIESNFYNKIEAENVEPISNREAILQMKLQETQSPADLGWMIRFKFYLFHAPDPLLFLLRNPLRLD